MGLFSGIHPDHAAAARVAQAYDDERIVATLVEAQSRWRWDGVLPPLAQQLTAACLAGAARRGLADRRLRVCDFGGGLGGGRAVLAAVLGPAVELDWDVVETPALARAGNARFAGPGLRFHGSLDALDDREHDIIIVSGVLQYLAQPAETFARLARRPHHHMVMNRFPIRRSAAAAVRTDVCTVQDLGLLHAGVSVPHWCFSEDRWRGVVDATHDTVLRWTDGFDGCHPLPDGSEVSFVGALLARRGPASSAAAP